MDAHSHTPSLCWRFRVDLHVNIPHFRLISQGHGWFKSYHDIPFRINKDRIRLPIQQPTFIMAQLRATVTEEVPLLPIGYSYSQVFVGAQQR